MPPLSLSPLSGRYLSFLDREEISLLIACGFTYREIGRRLHRSASTISREVARNCSPRPNGSFDYRATAAQWRTDERAKRPKKAKLAQSKRLRDYVQGRLSGLIEAPCRSKRRGPRGRLRGLEHGHGHDRRWATAWSPEQIAKRLLVDFPDDESMRISHEAIYQALYIQSRGALKRELVAFLRTGRVVRVPRARSRATGGFVSPDILISERPAEAEDRAIPGHWEGDLIMGSGSSAIGTLVERTTRFVMLLHLPRKPGFGQPRTKHAPPLTGHDAETVRNAIAAATVKLPQELRRSLTWDQGSEMAQHVQLRIDTGIDIYFCDPHSPWQRGTNENTNGLLRQYFPKGTDLSRHSRADLSAVAAALNARPRKTLNWKTPAEAFRDHLNSVQQRVATTT